MEVKNGAVCPRTGCMAYGIVFYFSTNTWSGNVKQDGGDAHNSYSSVAKLTVFPAPKDTTTEELSFVRFWCCHFMSA